MIFIVNSLLHNKSPAITSMAEPTCTHAPKLAWNPYQKSLGSGDDVARMAP